MLALALRAAMREAKHGFAHPKREHGSRTPKARAVHPTTDRSQSGKNDLSATEMCWITPVLNPLHIARGLRTEYGPSMEGIWA